MAEVRPDRECRFPRLKMPFCGQVALGNGTQWLFHLDAHRQALFVAVLQTSYRWGDHLHLLNAERPIKADLLATLFPKMLDGDAGNIADLLNDQRDAPMAPRQGYYHRNLLEGWQPSGQRDSGNGTKEA